MSPVLGPEQSPYDNDRHMLDEGSVDELSSSTEPQYSSFPRTDQTPYVYEDSKMLHETFMDRLRLNRGLNISEYWNGSYAAGPQTVSAAVHETWPESGERMHVECDVDHSTDTSFARGMGDVYECLSAGPTSNDKLAKSPTPILKGSDRPRKRPSKTRPRAKSELIEPESGHTRDTAASDPKIDEALLKELMTEPLSVDTDLLRDTPVIDMTWKAYRSREIRLGEPRNRHGDFKRPMNCFMFYRSAYLDRAKKFLELMPGVNEKDNQVISKVTTRSWDIESEVGKKKCRIFAAADKAGYDDVNPGGYRPCNNKSAKPRKKPSSENTGRGQGRTQSKPRSKRPGNKRRKQERPPATKGPCSSGTETQINQPEYTERAPLVAQVGQPENNAAQELQQAPDVSMPSAPYYFMPNSIELSMSDSSLPGLRTNEQETYSWQGLEDNHGNSSSLNGPLTPTFSMGAIDPTLTLGNSQDQYPLHENEKLEDFNSYFKEESDAILQTTCPLAQAAANQLWYHMGT